MRRRSLRMSRWGWCRACADGARAASRGDMRSSNHPTSQNRGAAINLGTAPATLTRCTHLGEHDPFCNDFPSLGFPKYPLLQRRWCFLRGFLAVNRSYAPGANRALSRLCKPQGPRKLRRRMPQPHELSSEARGWLQVWSRLCPSAGVGSGRFNCHLRVPFSAHTFKVPAGRVGAQMAA